MRCNLQKAHYGTLMSSFCSTSNWLLAHRFRQSTSGSCPGRQLIRPRHCSVSDDPLSGCIAETHELSICAVVALNPEPLHNRRGRFLQQSVQAQWRQEYVFVAIRTARHSRLTGSSRQDALAAVATPSTTILKVCRYCASNYHATAADSRRSPRPPMAARMDQRRASGAAGAAAAKRRLGHRAHPRHAQRCDAAAAAHAGASARCAFRPTVQAPAPQRG